QYASSFFFFQSRRRHTILVSDWSSDVCSSDLETEPRARRVLPTDAVSPLFEAALEATEEAVYNSLFQATTVKSKIGTAEAIPVEIGRASCRERVEISGVAVAIKKKERRGEAVG